MNIKKKIISLLSKKEYDKKTYNHIYQLLLIEHTRIEKTSEEFVHYIITYNGFVEMRNINSRPIVEERFF